MMTVLSWNLRVSPPSCPRFLEEGNIEEAEIQKQRIEQLQRERRRVLEENCVEHQPRFFRCARPAWGLIGTGDPGGFYRRKEDKSVPSPNVSVLGVFLAPEA